MMDGVYAVSLLSGGLDSSTLAYLLSYKAAANGGGLIFLSVDYGQRHRRELRAARRVADHISALHGSRVPVRHEVINLDWMAFFSNSALTRHQDVPEGHYAEDQMKKTIVPFRNPMMLSIAFMVAAGRSAQLVGAAVHAGDHFIYPDCRPEFAGSFQVMANEALRGSPTPNLFTPFIDLTKAEIVTKGHDLGVLFQETYSCYQGGESHCGRCGTCVERAEAFAVAGVKDPTPYEDKNYWRSVTQLKEFAV